MLLFSFTVTSRLPHSSNLKGKKEVDINWLNRNQYIGKVRITFKLVQLDENERGRWELVVENTYLSTS